LISPLLNLIRPQQAAALYTQLHAMLLQAEFPAYALGLSEEPSNRAAPPKTTSFHIYSYNGRAPTPLSFPVRPFHTCPADVIHELLQDTSFLPNAIESHRLLPVNILHDPLVHKVAAALGHYNFAATVFREVLFDPVQAHQQHTGSPLAEQAIRKAQLGGFLLSMACGPGFCRELIENLLPAILGRLHGRHAGFLVSQMLEFYLFGCRAALDSLIPKYLAPLLICILSREQPRHYSVALSFTLETLVFRRSEKMFHVEWLPYLTDIARQLYRLQIDHHFILSLFDLKHQVCRDTLLQVLIECVHESSSPADS
jgi:hypothetical protein